MLTHFAYYYENARFYRFGQYDADFSCRYQYDFRSSSFLLIHNEPSASVHPDISDGYRAFVLRVLS